MLDKLVEYVVYKYGFYDWRTTCVYWLKEWLG